MAAKTIIIGFDGLDRDILDDLIAKGETPAFAALKERSARVDLRSEPGMGAGVFWQSAATGTAPDYHGRYFYIQHDPRTYNVSQKLGRDEDRPPNFWKTLGEEGLRTHVTDWHRAFFQQTRNGVVIDNWRAHDPTGPARSHPKGAIRILASLFGDDPTPGGFGAKSDQHGANVADFMVSTEKRIAQKARHMADMAASGDWDLVSTTFGEAHDIGHYLFHYHDPSHPLYDAAMAEPVGDPIHRCYRALDAAVGAIVNAADEDAAIMVLAGPGMTTMVSANTAMAEIAQRLDTGGPPSAIDKVRAGYKSNMPFKLRSRISPLARLARRTFADHAMKTRRYFAIPHNDNAGAIRINLKGRERHGVVAPGAECKQVIADLTDALMMLRNKETGAPVVGNIVNLMASYDGPYAADLPDLYVEWDRENNSQNFATITSPLTGDIIVPSPLRTGDHTPDGFVWGKGIDASLMPAHAPAPPQSVHDIILHTARSQMGA
ncbi:MAG: alkaline phosphatase family protein [Pseudomonadota bacterium]